MIVDRLLPDLDANIVCGNSLVGSDFYTTEDLIGLTPDEGAEVNAFDWSTAFPQIAESHGFDAVVGNPPWLMAGYYVADSMPYFSRNYQTCTGKVDLYYLFLEKAIRLVNNSGRIGMIVPSKLFHTRAAKALRQMLAEGGWVQEIVDFGTDKIFSDATNYSCILSMSASSSGPVEVIRAGKNFSNLSKFTMERSELGSSPWHLIDPERRGLWEKIQSGTTTLESLCSHFGNGVQSGADSMLILSPEERDALGVEVEACAPILKGKNVRRFRATPSEVLVFPYLRTENEFRVMDEDQLAVRFPGTFDYLQTHRADLERRRWFKKGPVELSGTWYGMMYLDKPSSFDGPHLVTPALAGGSNFASDEDTLFVTGTAGVSSVILRSTDEEHRYFVLGVLNSTLLSEFLIDHSTPYQGNYFKFSAPYIRNAPIKVPDEKFPGSKQMAADISAVSMALTDSQHAPAELTKLNKRLNDLVLELYQVDDSELACLNL